MTSQEAGSPAGGGFPWPQRSYPGKRALDFALALGALLVASPVMLPVALAVKLSSPGPVFYRGVRGGLGGRRFTQLKFRSMRTDAGGDPFTAPSDPRVTAVGKFLRFTKLDELPQFINVLRGEMSIVGPRPEDASVVENLYTRDQLRVLSVRPGLACEIDIRYYPDFEPEIPANVNANQYYRSTILPMRLEEDLKYVDRMSIWLDLKIILQTAYCVFVKGWLIHRQQRKAAKAAEAR